VIDLKFVADRGLKRYLWGSFQNNLIILHSWFLFIRVFTLIRRWNGWIGCDCIGFYWKM